MKIALTAGLADYAQSAEVHVVSFAGLCFHCELRPVFPRTASLKPPSLVILFCAPTDASTRFKLTWLVLGGDPAARSHRVEQFTAL